MITISFASCIVILGLGIALLVVVKNDPATTILGIVLQSSEQCGDSSSSVC